MSATTRPKSKAKRTVVILLVASAFLSSTVLCLLLGVRSTSLTTVVTPPPTTMVATQYVDGFASAIAYQSPGGSLIGITQLTAPSFRIENEKTPRYYIEGRRVSEAEALSRTRSAQDGVGLTLIDDVPR